MTAGVRPVVEEELGREEAVGEEVMEKGNERRNGM